VRGAKPEAAFSFTFRLVAPADMDRPTSLNERGRRLARHRYLAISLNNALSGRVVSCVAWRSAGQDFTSLSSNCLTWNATAGAAWRISGWRTGTAHKSNGIFAVNASMDQTAISLGMATLESNDLEESGRVEVTAELTAQSKSDAILEQVVGRLSLEPTVSAASWSVGPMLE
jgi:hypothetical protein